MEKMFFHPLHLSQYFYILIRIPPKTLDSHQLLLLRRKLCLRDHPGVKQLFVLLDLLDWVGCLSWSGLWYWLWSYLWSSLWFGCLYAVIDFLRARIHHVDEIPGKCMKVIGFFLIAL